MKITAMEPGYRKQARIWIDDEYRFSLYENEIKKYGIAEEMEITEAFCAQIMEETVLKRGKQKALSLLKQMDYTEGELRFKLKQSGYPPEIIEKTVDYINSYHYLNDEEYARNFLASRQKTKSIRQMKAELAKKGVDSRIIERCLCETEVSEAEAVKKAIRKKTKDVETLSYEEKRKIAASLYRKGFREEEIQRQLLL